jgi:hypothetical protein
MPPSITDQGGQMCWWKITQNFCQNKFSTLNAEQIVWATYVTKKVAKVLKMHNLVPLITKERTMF